MFCKSLVLPLLLRIRYSPTPVIATPPIPTRHSGVSSGGSSRSTFVLLALFGGGLGLHNFYAKRTRAEVLNIIFSVVMLVAFIFANVCMNKVNILCRYNLYSQANFYEGLARFSMAVAAITLIVQIVTIIRAIFCCKTDGNGVPMT